MAIQLYLKIILLILRLAYCTKPKLPIAANHDSMVNLYCDCGACFLNTQMKLELSNIHGRPKKNELQLRFGLLKRFI